MPDVPRRDGDGWVRCSLGHRHWGRFGAAGLLLHAADSASRCCVLLQHRAWWTHHGGTWGLPGGARSSDEAADATALRETREEAVLDLDGIELEGVYVDDHGGWCYSTVLARAPRPLPVTAASHETAQMRWVPLDEVTAMDLHPGLASSWPQVTAMLATSGSEGPPRP